MRFTGLESPVFKNPFTVVDPTGSVWTVATDRVWFVAVKNKNTCPRFNGESSALFTVLRLIGLEPTGPTTFDRRGTLDLVEPDGIGRVLGVPVSLRRLHDLLESLPSEELEGWNASKDLGVPCVGLACEGWRAFLIGFEGVSGDAPECRLDVHPPTAFDRAMSLDED